MGMAEPLRELRGLSDDEVIRRHDAAAQGTQIGTQHYLNEMARRDAERQTNKMLLMTLVITVATIVNVGVFIWDLAHRGVPSP
jgi:hypothetical protein